MQTRILHLSVLRQTRRPNREKARWVSFSLHMISLHQDANAKACITYEFSLIDGVETGISIRCIVEQFFRVQQGKRAVVGKQELVPHMLQHMVQDGWSSKLVFGIKSSWLRVQPGDESTLLEITCCHSSAFQQRFCCSTKAHLFDKSDRRQALSYESERHERCEQEKVVVRIHQVTVTQDCR